MYENLKFQQSSFIKCWSNCCGKSFFVKAYSDMFTKEVKGKFESSVEFRSRHDEFSYSYVTGEQPQSLQFLYTHISLNFLQHENLLTLSRWCMYTHIELTVHVCYIFKSGHDFVYILLLFTNIWTFSNLT